MDHVEIHFNDAGYARCLKIIQRFAIPSANLLSYGDDYWYQDISSPCE